MPNLVDQLRDSWPALVAEHGPRVRAILDELDPALWDTDPWLVAAYAASFRCINPSSRSAALPYFAAATSMMTDATPSAERISIGLHHSAALRGLGRLGEALERATDAAALVDADPTLPLSARIGLGCRASLQKGLALYHLGDYDRATVELRLSAGLADAHLYRSERVECCAAIAMVQYALGDFERSGQSVARAREASADSGLMEAQFGAAALIAELLVCVEQARLADAEAIAPVVAAASERSDWEPLGFYSRAAMSIISEEYVEGLELLRLCLQSYSKWNPPGSIVTISEGLKATILLRLGEAESAWDILGSIAPTQHHSNCPGRFVAHLRLTSGDTHGALRALIDCETLGDSHSSRTLVDVLLIRAAATHQLANFAMSDVSFDRAMMLAAGNNMSTPFRLVPNSLMRAMIVRAELRPQPARVRQLFDRVRDAGSVVGGMDAALLSEREREIVRAFCQQKSVVQIAESLYISVNTVKTHLKSIYRKLGVSSRADAVKRARTLGLHLDITPRSPSYHPL